MKRLDALLIAAILLVAGGLWAGRTLFSGGDAALVAEVYIDGNLSATYPLSRDHSEVLESAYGSNTIEITAETARIAASDCPGQDCVHSPAIGTRGQVLACLPNRLLVRIAGDATPEEVDIVAG